MREIIKGRAILVTMPWHQTEIINILVIYAPNVETENQAFWDKLDEEWDSENLPLPDILLGDFNVVEEQIDHMPMHQDSNGSVNSLGKLKEKFTLSDGWRQQNPNKIAFTLNNKQLALCHALTESTQLLYSSRTVQNGILKKLH
jgi:exonuclease III